MAVKKKKSKKNSIIKDSKTLVSNAEKKMRADKKPELKVVPEVKDKKPIKPETEEAKEPGVSDNFHYGYIVGLTKEDRFVFESFGDKIGFTELTGIHKYATLEVSRQEDKIFMTRDALTNEVGKAVAALSQQIGQLTQLLSQPQNKIPK